MFNTTIMAKSGHTLHVHRIRNDMIPEGLAHSDTYKIFYEVRNWDKNGVLFFILGKDERAPLKFVGWYPNTKSMWSSYGKTLEDAINGMQVDGWKYA